MLPEHELTSLIFVKFTRNLRLSQISYLPWKSSETCYFLSFILEENHLYIVCLWALVLEIKLWEKKTQNKLTDTFPVKKILDNNFETFVIGGCFPTWLIPGWAVGCQWQVLLGAATTDGLTSLPSTADKYSSAQTSSKNKYSFASWFFRLLWWFAIFL